ncbi:NAD-dependent aldehyde dehydrogenase [Legionella oakridgensis ATCC 33761 = DSM 21215]|uniref:L-glutamate gamma-semialdehyde dehydrogenase n=1 Tax=Legionella oakridgensis ATCC 33761 = DSM 21215 TaxID=1268635 RepID=W0BF18_9GAMM|nr:succinylglutamate-semialdehyde dehydrogenase [Legionella oakridgensis]AHE67251.1 NAD-dependent aldehyde dehydrogenase [Legionella oakridgensis ATCC 33761 = DSM 21215]
MLGPFNFPAHLSNGHIVPALLAGNTVVYKPSELAPAVAELILQCWHDSGLPGGVLNGIQGDATSAQLLLQQDIQGVYFTGSYKTGLAIHQQFSKRPDIILALEMGGNNPLIIDTVKDMQAALYHTMISAFITAGQRCTCARRVMIPDDHFGDQFLEHFIQSCKKIRVGQFTETPEPFMGPVIRHAHALTHLKTQEQLKTAGGNSLLAMSLLVDNTGLLSPGIMDMSQVKHPADEEIFAPFVQIYRYHHFEDALVLANQTQYGLAAGVITDHYERYEQFYHTIRAGLINWNRPTTGAASNMPFGGIGHSGNHRPSAYFAADYCVYPIASLEQPQLSTPKKLLPGIELF